MEHLAAVPGQSTAPLPRRGSPRRGLLGVVLLLLCFDAICGLSLVESRDAAGKAARHFARNLSLAVSHDVGRSIELYSQSLLAAQQGSQLPGVWQLAPDLRNRVLFDGAASAGGFGNMLVINEQGEPVADSRFLQPRQVNVADRDYFKAHRAQAGLGLLISGPAYSRLNNTHVLMLSRRIDHADSSFAGVVVGAIQLNYFHEQLQALLQTQSGTITLCDRAGTVIMQQPYLPEAVGKPVQDGVVLRLAQSKAESGSGTGAAEPGGARQIFAFQAVAGTDLLVGVTLAENDVLAIWRKRAAATSLLMLTLTGSTLAMVLLLGREYRRRAEAERTALAAGEALQLMNDTLEAQVAEEVGRREDAQNRLAQAQRMEALGQLASGIAHDFNNVLQSVGSAGQALLKQPDNAGQVMRMARLIADTCARGSAITGRLLGFAHKRSSDAQPFAPAELLANLQQIVEHTLGRAYDVRVIAPPGLPDICADRPQLETVLINLATNARDAMPAGGTLLLCAETATVDAAARTAPVPPGRYVRLTVRDTGHGMDEATLARASEPFFTTKPVGKGTGLGLSMAKGFAAQSKGGLSIESALGHGTAVTLWLPQADLPATGHAKPATDAPPVSAPTISAHVLLVDDDPLICELLADDLRERGHMVEQAQDSAAALACIERGLPCNVLVTDLNLPGLNGVQLIRAIRALRPNLPAIIVSGASEDAQPAGHEAGDGPPVLFLGKPIRGADLARHVQSVLVQSQARQKQRQSA